MGFLLVFIGPGGGGGFELFLPVGGNSPIKKLLWGFAQGDGQAWN